MERTAILSVSNKNDIVFLAEALHFTHQYRILSSGGTANILEAAGIPVTRISNYTGFPEIMNGRVKTLHPLIYGGILANRDELSHQRDLEANGITLIDLVVVNLYPFRETVSQQSVDWKTAIENIDIGGPSMIRAAAKNHPYVTILTDPDQYQSFLSALYEDSLDLGLRQHLAVQAFDHTARYDAAINRWMMSRLKNKTILNTHQGTISNFLLSLPLQQKLRYGENPHQQGSWYTSKDVGWGGISQIEGKELSANNLLDLDAALAIIREFGYLSTGGQFESRPSAVVIKHTNPCGVATGVDGFEALTRALDADRVSAFGGIIALNSTVNVSMAKELTSLFLECIIAPDFTSDALEELQTKKNLRLLILKPEAIDKANHQQLRSLLGGILVQDLDDEPMNTQQWSIVTQRFPNEQEMIDLAFAWALVRHVRSNAIVIARNGQSLGIGAGQMNRIGSAHIALNAAGNSAYGAVLASDGFFPFDDTVKAAAAKGIKAIIQPGGSLRDNESIKACNELGLVMVTTKQRHFLH
uniref:Phosphoribosylaminoimidazolecarboxamide formyltransferase/IMP cyclohydrolase n=1 Tax=Paulinella micropora TaxID=1928728 RepID=A0A385I0N5_9EUKA|nr:phosphoribosylaminoimidazolecarboxamide formyltransferase/IMP cyclohydrolase [Paulinella micropora]AXY63444.1 phosphoribosylaminoimidazolecarboxamide formyltransferase/IMP cyclohydrolase [Paulinella micropora]